MRNSIKIIIALALVLSMDIISFIRFDDKLPVTTISFLLVFLISRIKSGKKTNDSPTA